MDYCLEKYSDGAILSLDHIALAGDRSANGYEGRLFVLQSGSIECQSWGAVNSKPDSVRFGYN